MRFAIILFAALVVMLVAFASAHQDQDPSEDPFENVKLLKLKMKHTTYLSCRGKCVPVEYESNLTTAQLREIQETGRLTHNWVQADSPAFEHINGAFYGEITFKKDEAARLSLEIEELDGYFNRENRNVFLSTSDEEPICHLETDQEWCGATTKDCSYLAVRKAKNENEGRSS